MLYVETKNNPVNEPFNKVPYIPYPDTCEIPGDFWGGFLCGGPVTFASDRCTRESRRARVCLLLNNIHGKAAHSRQRIKFAQFEQPSRSHAVSQDDLMVVTEQQEYLQRAQHCRWSRSLDSERVPEKA